MKIGRAVTVLALLTFTPLAASAGELISGPIRVCRQPTLASNANFAKSVAPGPDAWSALAKQQAEEARNCFEATNVEIGSKTLELDVGLGTRCAEYDGRAGNERVFIIVGPKGAWGRCP